MLFAQKYQCIARKFKKTRANKEEKREKSGKSEMSNLRFCYLTFLLFLIRDCMLALLILNALLSPTMRALHLQVSFYLAEHNFFHNQYEFF